MEQLLTNVANGTVKLDENALVPLAQIPDTLTGKDADTVDGIHASTTGEAGKLIRADEVDDKITAHKNNASAHHTKTTSSEIDHGSIQGLGDDDHTQYLTTGRHDTTARHPVGVLKKATGSYDTGGAFSPGSGSQTFWFSPHQYAFSSPQIRLSSTIVDAKLNLYAGSSTGSTDWRREWRLVATSVGEGTAHGYVQWDYLQGSPPYELPHYIYLQQDKETGQIVGAWEAPDPPWIGIGDVKSLPHPFGKRIINGVIKPIGQIILIAAPVVKDVLAEAHLKQKRILEVISDEMEIGKEVTLESSLKETEQILKFGIQYRELKPKNIKEI